MTAITDIFGSSAQTSTSLYGDKSGEVMGKEDFLTLLVAQLKNQDPMNPDDPTEFTAQLAQFSSLEQLFNINESMDSLTSAQKQSDRFATMDLIGKTVSYEDGDFKMEEEGSASVGYKLDGLASSVTLYIKDQTGNTVTTLHPTELNKGNHFIDWNGMNSDGNHVPAGDYKIVLQAAAGYGEESIAVSPLVQSEVTGVDFNNSTGDAILHTLAGAEISSDSILAVYQKDSNRTTASNNNETNEESLEDEIISAAGTAAVSATESALTDEEQIEQDQLEHHLAGTN
jgi:flagellar basal-body rod modification protein FlgD